MTAVWIVGGVIIYLLCSGFINQISRAVLEERCTEGDHYSGRSHPYCMHTEHAFLVSLFWPLSIWAMVGYALSEYVGSRGSRAEAKEQRRAAEHSRKLAEMEANIRLLEAHGVKARVDGIDLP